MHEQSLCVTALGLSTPEQKCHSCPGESPQPENHANAAVSVILTVSNIRVFSDFQRVIHLNSEVAHSALQFAVTE